MISGAAAVLLLLKWYWKGLGTEDKWMPHSSSSVWNTKPIPIPSLARISPPYAAQAGSSHVFSLMRRGKRMWDSLLKHQANPDNPHFENIHNEYGWRSDTWKTAVVERRAMHVPESQDL